MTTSGTSERLCRDADGGACSFSSFTAGFLLGLAITLGVGCAGLIGAPIRYDYFRAPDSSDAWSPKIEAWRLTSLLPRSGLSSRTAIQQMRSRPATQRSMTIQCRDSSTWLMAISLPAMVATTLTE